MVLGLIKEGVAALAENSATYDTVLLDSAKVKGKFIPHLPFHD